MHHASLLRHARCSLHAFVLLYGTSEHLLSSLPSLCLGLLRCSVNPWSSYEEVHHHPHPPRRMYASWILAPHLLVNGSMTGSWPEAMSLDLDTQICQVFRLLFSFVCRYNWSISTLQKRVFDWLTV